MNAVQDKLYIANLKADECGLGIRESLQSLIGVLAVNINVAEGCVEIEHEDFTDIESLQDALKSLGYKVTSFGTEKGNAGTN